MDSSGEVLNVYKPVGWTPLEALNKLEEIYPDYDFDKSSYAGKLDPMAEGVQLILLGDAIEDQEFYQNMDKEYVAEIVFGFSTDSYDLLGLVEETLDEFSLGKTDIRSELESWKGVHEVKLPAFSSFSIEGKPLFQWARESKLDEIEVPKKSMECYDVSLMSFFEKEADSFKGEVSSKIERVSGDFRQEEILNKWKSVLEADDRRNTYQAVRVKFKCASGTYIRSIVNEIGKDLKVPAVLSNLARTKVGLGEKTFWAGNSIKLEK